MIDMRDERFLEKLLQKLEDLPPEGWLMEHGGEIVANEGAFGDPQHEVTCYNTTFEGLRVRVSRIAHWKQERKRSWWFIKKKWIDKRWVTYTVSVTDQETGAARGNVQFDVPSLEPRIEELYFAIKEKTTNYLVQYREAQRAKSADIQRRSNQEVADRLRRYLDPE